ncbi:hypothetical protein D3C80_140780 [compost metagenome]
MQALRLKRQRWQCDIGMTMANIIRPYRSAAGYGLRHDVRQRIGAQRRSRQCRQDGNRHARLTGILRQIRGKDRARTDFDEEIASLFKRFRRCVRKTNGIPDISPPVNSIELITAFDRPGNAGDELYVAGPGLVSRDLGKEGIPLTINDRMMKWIIDIQDVDGNVLLATNILECFYFSDRTGNSDRGGRVDRADLNSRQAIPACNLLRPVRRQSDSSHFPFAGKRVLMARSNGNNRNCVFKRKCPCAIGGRDFTNRMSEHHPGPDVSADQTI